MSFYDVEKMSGQTHTTTDILYLARQSRPLSRKEARQQRQQKSPYLPPEIIVEIFQHLPWHIRFTISRVSRTFNYLSKDILYSKAYFSTPLHGISTLHNTLDPVVSTHRIFPLIRLERPEYGPGLHIKVLRPLTNNLENDNSSLLRPIDVQTSKAFPRETTIYTCPFRHAPATNPPICKMQLRLQFQRDFTNPMRLEEWKPAPTYRHWIIKGVGECSDGGRLGKNGCDCADEGYGSSDGVKDDEDMSGDNGRYVTVLDVCECIQKTLSRDQYLTEWKVWIGKLHHEGGQKFSLDWSTFTH